MKQTIQLLLVALALSLPASAVPVQYYYSQSFPSGVTVPDNDFKEFTLHTTIPAGLILDVDVYLKSQDGYNPDLFATLSFGLEDTSPTAVLLERISGDTSGMEVWLDEQASQNVSDVGGSGLLSGSFQPSGPAPDYALSIFNGLNPNSATWKLTISDEEFGSETALFEWGLLFTVDAPASAVPEQGAGILCAAGTFAGLLALRRRIERPA